MSIDMRDYQQLHSGDPHGGVNCTAYCGAILVAADGHTTTTGEKVRAATNEPTPDPKSPGLNLPQVDTAVRKLTKIDLDTRLGDTVLDAEQRIRDGRWATVQVTRGVLVDHGFAGANPFRGGHAITVHILPFGEDVPIFGDPLVPYFIRASWGSLWAAARGIAGAGRANVSFTRDLIPEYRVSVKPTPPHKRREFHVFHVKNGRIVRREVDVTTGFTQPCTPPRWYPWAGHEGRSLVGIEAGKRKGLYVRSFWSEEV